MAHDFKEVLSLKAIKTDADKEMIFNAVKNEMQKFSFDKDYLNEGALEIVSCFEVKFHTCTLENFTDTREIFEDDEPNAIDIPLGKKSMSDFNSWDYNLTYEKEFQNSVNNHNIEDSFHAIGCRTCAQRGKVRCDDCRGSGENTCYSCSGRGENQCSSCSGRGEIKCWSCWGTGTIKTGYGENERIERCSSCSGRGYNSCSSCRNGYITCSRCSGRGRVTCDTCDGDGEVRCGNCRGYRTMAHYFVVNAHFNNIKEYLFLTNPFPGYDHAKANSHFFATKSKLFEYKENRFRDGYFEQLQTHQLFRQINSFFDFKDSNESKLISSRFSVYENKYFEVSFSFYDELYYIYFDSKLEGSYFNGKKPTDQYELDLLKKSISAAIQNDLAIAKKTIEKLSNYNFITINEKDLISAIDDTQSIYEAHNNIERKNYSAAEDLLKGVSIRKKTEGDYESLVARLNRIYSFNTSIFGSVGFVALVVLLYVMNFNHFLLNIVIGFGIILITLLSNKIIRNIHWARWPVLVIMGLQLVINLSQNTQVVSLDYISTETDTPTVFVFEDVFNPATGRTWMDRNLGATRAATSSTDIEAYGDLYQWGRGPDGHQKRNSASTKILADIDAPIFSNFILTSSLPYDWRSFQNNNLWQGVNGVNNPCPSGYKIPSVAEWEEEINSWTNRNLEGAIQSRLRLPLAGHRNSESNTINSEGTWGNYWSNNVMGTGARAMYISSNSSLVGNYNRASGFSVRCIKD